MTRFVVAVLLAVASVNAAPIDTLAPEGPKPLPDAAKLAIRESQYRIARLEAAIERAQTELDALRRDYQKTITDAITESVGGDPKAYALRLDDLTVVAAPADPPEVTQ